MVETPTSWTETEAQAIREQLERMLQTELFAQANKLCRFLSYIVEATLSGQAERLNQFAVGVDVFGRDETFDPVTDSIVRVEAGRLRSKLTEYYAGAGQSDPVVISLPKGGYGVSIEMKSFDDPPRESPTSGQFSPGRIGVVALVSALAIGGIYAIFFMRPDSGALDDVSISDHATVVDELSQTVQIQSAIPFDKPSIAVLPFDNMSADANQEYFSDGISEDIITDLSIVSGLTVIARHSTFVYKGRSIGIKEIGEELGARYVLEGSVRKHGDQLRITAQLIDASKNARIWADRYDRKLDDVFAIQSEVSQKIVAALDLELTAIERARLGHKGTNNVAAYDLFLRAREQFHLFGQANIEHSIELLSRAIDLDPNFAEAYAWKARVITFTYISGFNTSKSDTIVPALHLARKAIEIDALLPIAHANLGWALRWHHEFEQALAAIRTAIDLDPNFADAYLWQSLTMSAMVLGQEALDSVTQGIHLNPNYSVTYILALGRAHFALGDYNEALLQFDRGINRNPNFLINHVYKIFSLEKLGELEKAAAAETELAQIFPDYKFSGVYLFYIDELKK